MCSVSRSRRSHPGPRPTVTVGGARRGSSRSKTLTAVGIPYPRAESIIALAREVADRTREAGGGGRSRPHDGRLLGLPGIGRWTAEYIAMRALGWPDAFPHGDVALRNSLGGVTATRADELCRSVAALAQLRHHAPLAGLGLEPRAGEPSARRPAPCRARRTRCGLGAARASWSSDSSWVRSASSTWRKSATPPVNRSRASSAARRARRGGVAHPLHPVRARCDSSPARSRPPPAPAARSDRTAPAPPSSSARAPSTLAFTRPRLSAGQVMTGPTA